MSSKSKAIVGVSTKNKIISVPLSEIGFVLVSGHGGSGKSIAIRSLIVSLLATTKKDELKFIIADFHKSEYLAYRGMPFMLKDPIDDEEEIIETLQYIKGEVERRLEIMANRRYRNIDKFNQSIDSGELENEEKLPHIVFVFDEFYDFLSNNKESMEILKTIAIKGRMSGIHLILSTQLARKDIIDKIKSYVDTNIALLTTPIESEVVLGEKRAEKLSRGGDFYFTHRGSGFERGQVPYIDREELESIFKYIKEYDSQNKIQNESKSIFKRIFKGKNKDVEHDEEYRFPLTLFKERKELIDERKNKAEKYAKKELEKKIKKELSSNSKTNFNLSAKRIVKNTVTYTCILPLKSKLPDLEELKNDIERATNLNYSIEINLEGKFLEIIIPLPKEYQIPIDVKTMIEEAF